MDRLDARAIALPGIEVRVLERCTSTNDLLLAAGDPDVLLAAEEQTAGRGRRGRRWHAAPGTAVTFSLAKLVHRAPRELPGLALVAGVGAARALRSLGAARTALKWPNDLVLDGAKLGGILVETRSHASATLAVIGIGINGRRDAAFERRLRRPVAWLERHIDVDRNRLISCVAASVIEALAQFEARGLEPLRAQWQSMDAHAGERLRVRLADGRVLTGVAHGLDEDGALRLQTARGMRAVRSARVLRARVA
ncbi:MAG: biotin--[acetyl-CoA-carboxylase] ligase [Betaproteobacteria bacterium]|nr:MAG: biotin--[acetyl-CoA-carboxylase] ligase [Betaproteobacteria bacterium]